MKQIITGIILLVLLIACSKQQPVRQGAASLMVFHAVAGGNLLKTSYKETLPAGFYSLNNLVYGSYTANANLYGAVAGNTALNIYQVPDTVAKSEPLFKLQISTPEGSMNSLFLTGTPAAPESVFVNDHPISFKAGDSAMGIRFVNLLPDNIPVSINLAAKEQGSEVADLDYKGVTDFKRYAVNRSQADYVFEFRNAGNGTLIATYTTTGIANDGKLVANPWIYKNFAFALIGRTGFIGELAPKIVRINYARAL